MWRARIDKEGRHRAPALASQTVGPLLIGDVCSSIMYKMGLVGAGRRLSWGEKCLLDKQEELSWSLGNDGGKAGHLMSVRDLFWGAETKGSLVLTGWPA